MIRMHDRISHVALVTVTQERFLIGLKRDAAIPRRKTCVRCLPL